MAVRFLATLFGLLLLAGCSDPQPTDDDVVDDAPDGTTLTASRPTVTKYEIMPTATGPTPVDQAVADLSGNDPNVVRFQIPEGTGWFQLAVDFGDPSDQGQPEGEVTFNVEAPGGAKILESGKVSMWKKSVTRVDAPAAGEYLGRAVAQGNWKLGVVVSTFPVDYTPGLIVNISAPEQTRVEHQFYPDEITVKAGVATRVTLFDYDPHYGIDNNQHNWAVGELGVKTPGYTNWGGVYTVDFTPEKVGEFQFECEYHQGMTGTLVVV